MMARLQNNLQAKKLWRIKIRHEKPELYFWTREQKNSNAEVDYLMVINGKIIPVEVKSGATGRLKSLKLFMEEKKSRLGLRISENPFSFNDNILSVPFYLIKEIPRLLQEID